MGKKIIGRDTTCDFIIFDPKNRVSRKHLELAYDGNEYFIKDLQSTNGTFVNGKKIESDKVFKISSKDKVTLSLDYPLDILKVFSNEDSTKVLNNNNSESTIIFNNSQATYNDGKRTVIFDIDKTQIGDISDIDSTPFITIGRSIDNKIAVNNPSISRNQCKIRLLTPFMVEIEDLGSTNGTYADEGRLNPNLKYKFASSVKIRFGKDYNVDLKKIFPNIQIIQKQKQDDTIISNNQQPQRNIQPQSPNATKYEMSEFNDLEEVWTEYIERQNQANNSTAAYSIGGALLGLAAVALTATTGVGGILMMSGGGILGRYLGQNKSNEIRNDLTYEEAFLETYSCPRCKESFQKKPWITIRDCNKCRVKFRK